MRPHHTAAPNRRPGRTSASILSVGVGAGLAVAWVSGCSVIYDLETKQCTSTNDCQALGGVFAGLECIENICQEPTGCTTNVQCLDADTTGAPVVCVERQCVQLTSTECPKVLPSGDGDVWLDMLRDDPLILAGTGLVNQSSDVRLLNYEMALLELRDAVGGIGPGGNKPVIMLACNANVADDAELDRLMDHVVNRLGVPGIVSAFTADNLQRAFNQFGSDPDVLPFFMSAVESDPLLETLQDDGRVWAVGASANVIARAYAPLLTDVVRHLGLEASEVRVAVVQLPGERFMTNTVTTLTAAPADYGLFFNGAGVFENNASGHYLGVTVEGAVSQQTIDQLITFKPHVIISAGSREFVNLIPEVETGWDEETQEQAKPFYVLSVYNYNDDAVTQLVQSSPALRLRLAGVNVAAAPDPAIYNAYTLRWDDRFRADGLAGFRGAENFYDAPYYLIYSAAAAGNVRTGRDLSLGMARLLTGTAVPMGPDGFVTGFSQLAVPQNRISLLGTMGPPDFNPLTGTRTSGAGSVYCVDAAGAFHADVLRYVPPAEGANATTASLTGSFPTECFPTW